MFQHKRATRLSRHQFPWKCSNRGEGFLNRQMETQRHFLLIGVGASRGKGFGNGSLKQGAVEVLANRDDH